MLINADVDERVDLFSMDPQSRGLFPALVTPRSVSGFESQHQALGKVLRLTDVESRSHCAQHFRAGEHIADYRHPHPCDFSGPWRTFPARMGGDCSASIHNGKLPEGACLITSERGRHCVDRACSLLQFCECR